MTAMVPAPSATAKVTGTAYGIRWIHGAAIRHAKRDNRYQVVHAGTSNCGGWRSPTVRESTTEWSTWNTAYGNRSRVAILAGDQCDALRVRYPERNTNAGMWNMYSHCSNVSAMGPESGAIACPQTTSTMRSPTAVSIERSRVRGRLATSGRAEASVFTISSLCVASS
nr:hypothetical protein [Demequina litorisediminis]